MSNKADVWISKRKSKRGIVYSVRWIDIETGKWRSTVCGPERKHAKTVAATKRHELEAGIRGEVRRVNWADFVAEHVATIDGHMDRSDTDFSSSQQR